MKHLWKILVSLATLFALIQITYSGPLGVEKIDVLDENTLSLTLSDNPNVKVGDVDAEITILNDMKLRGSLLSDSDTKKIDILLENPLQPNTKYSLLTLAGTQGSIDFETPAGVEWFIQENISSIQDEDISMIEIVDDRTISVSYNQELSEGIYEFKLLAESTVTNIQKVNYDDAEILITLEPTLISEQDYILMIIDMKDVDGNYLEFDTGIYDFTTPVIESSADTQTSTDNDQLSASWAQVIDTNVEAEGSLDVMQIDTETVWDVELNAAGEEVSLENAQDESNIEEVALAATGTPDTGAATWVLILATLFINSFYYIARRKKMQVA